MNELTDYEFQPGTWGGYKCQVRPGCSYTVYDIRNGRIVGERVYGEGGSLCLDRRDLLHELETMNRVEPFTGSPEQFGDVGAKGEVTP